MISWKGTRDDQRSQIGAIPRFGTIALERMASVACRLAMVMRHIRKRSTIPVQID